MKVKFIYILLFICIVGLQAQDRLISKNNYAKFYSHAPLEDITAENHQVSSVIDLNKKEIVVKMLIKHFRFDNALMEEHFNENYMESEKFPAAVFRGMYVSTEDVTMDTGNEYALDVSGQLTIHGIERSVSTKATLRVDGDKLKGSTMFVLKPKDFNIEIPSVVVKNIAEEIEVTVELTYDIKVN